MRAIFIKLDTTPSPCKAAQDAYLAHCNAMLKQSEDRCTKEKAYFKLNPKCYKACLARHLKEIKPFVKRIKNYQEIIAHKQVIIANKERLIKNPATPAGQKNEAIAAKKRQEDAIGNLEFRVQGEQIGINSLVIDYVVQVQEIANFDAARLDLLATKKELIQAIKNVNVIPKCSPPSAITEFNCKK